ncbi:glycosyltransferase [uncultured Algimonas sp.]|uniref:glycosyltransferase n=1 Tax=uncultured Algimonas sp. TaxID=1547920 RepID=UPI002612CED5|nr:glycosyltransferase [uncultured Algimonas sp.]
MQHNPNRIRVLHVVIPTYRAEAGLARLLPQLSGDRVIVADGGSDDGTLGVALRHGAVLAVGARGRGAQLALGARLAGLSGRAEDWFLFLHADSRLPEGWREAIDAAMGDRDPRYFGFRADADGPKARLMDAMVALRCAALGLPYGDQGLLVSRALYERVGGYADMDLFEDVELVERLRRVARLRPLPLALTTDISEHERDGIWRRGARNLGLLWRYKRGAEVADLLARYKR